MEFAPVRFNQLQRYLKKVSDKTLSQNLKELERDGLITRTVYPQIRKRSSTQLATKPKSWFSPFLRTVGSSRAP